MTGYVRLRTFLMSDFLLENLDFFRFVTMQAFDRPTDRQTDRQTE